jgi:uncharacterized protein
VSEMLTPIHDRKAALKSVIHMLHSGADPEVVKSRFADVIDSLTAEEIARIEQELIDDGMPSAEVERLCPVHMAVFQDALENEEKATPRDHPVDILMREHELLLELGGRLRDGAAALRRVQDSFAAEAMLGGLRELQSQIRASQCHYVREENVIFPYLEKHGVVHPPMIMWSEHDRIRAVEKRLEELFQATTLDELREVAGDLEGASEELVEMFSSHFYKENNILFPTALRLFTEQEWEETRRQFAELGYWQIVPAALETVAPASEVAAARQVEGEIVFETGSLPVALVEKLLDTLPVDMTFVDAQDNVSYFSNGRDRVFPRTKAIIGRNVQQCHPEKSVHVVNQILDDFRNGSRDSAEFWIQMAGKFVHIRYFAVRNGAEYLGCLEVTQDATELRALQGEKRLL